MSPSISGIHHVTAITADAQANVDFYCGVLGLRLVKRTVNFDDPGSYHLYYADGLGRPGTVLTFFAWPGARRGRIGPPQVSTTAFSAPEGSLEYWAARLKERGVVWEKMDSRFGASVLAFSDPDGMKLEIVASSQPGPGPAVPGPIPTDTALRGFHGVTLSEEGYEHTARLLSDVMGYRAAGAEGNLFRYRAQGEGAASVVDLLCVPGAPHGGMGAGAVHHVAFRAADDAEQLAWREEIVRLGRNVSPVMDRQYFHSIYFREPGGVLFEIATDLPGFATDEALEHLGEKLMLPPWLEPHRADIEKALPSLRLPEWRGQP